MQPGTENLLRRELTALPALTPSPEIDARVLAAMRAVAAESAVGRAAAEGRAAPRPRRKLAFMAMAMAMAAAAAVAALTLVLLTPPGGGSGERPEIAATAPLPAPIPAPAAAASDDYRALVERSARLERALFMLPAQRPVMSASTAGTIATLEDRITFIDAGLTQASIAGAEVGEREVLWRERVEVMNALLQVRYAQSRVFDF